MERDANKFSTDTPEFPKTELMAEPMPVKKQWFGLPVQRLRDMGVVLAFLFFVAIFAILISNFRLKSVWVTEYNKPIRSSEKTSINVKKSDEVLSVLTFGVLDGALISDKTEGAAFSLRR